MPQDYAPKVTLAETLIDKFMETGAPLSQLIKKTESGVDYNPTITESSTDCKAVILTHNQKHMDGTFIRATDKLIYLSTEGLGVVPELHDDFITPDGERLTLVEPITPLQPGTSVIFWALNGRAS